MTKMIVFTVTLITTPAFAQQKMDLDDVSIKGELHGDERLRLLARDRNHIKNYVQYRTSFRNEIIEGLMRPEPRYEYQPMQLPSVGISKEEDP